jgi:K+-sensing histidine kinase KdpD
MQCFWEKSILFSVWRRRENAEDAFWAFFAQGRFFALRGIDIRLHREKIAPEQKILQKAVAPAPRLLSLRERLIVCN